MTERSEKPVRSGISKAQSATDGNSLYWTWEYPTVHLCLIASCSLFLQQKQTKSILQYTQLHEYHKAAHTVTEVRHWHSGHNGHSAQNTQLNNFSHLLYINACISQSTIYSILLQTCTHNIHTQLNKFRGGVSPCQSQEEFCILLQIRNNARACLCVKHVCALGEKNKRLCFCPPSCVEAYLH